MIPSNVKIVGIPICLAVGNGDGPKNVLLDPGDGTRTVVTWSTWKRIRKGEFR